MSAAVFSPFRRLVHIAKTRSACSTRSASRDESRIVYRDGLRRAAAQLRMNAWPQRLSVRSSCFQARFTTSSGMISSSAEISIR